MLQLLGVISYYYRTGEGGSMRKYDTFEINGSWLKQKCMLLKEREGEEKSEQ